MSVNNVAILRNGLQKFRKEQYDLLEAKLVKFCGKIMSQAIDARLLADGAHNFTGNLINSIVVGLFREGKLVMYVSPDPWVVDKPIMKKMTYPFKYYFSESNKKSRGGRRSLGLDWDQTHPSSFYSPEMKTNKSYGGTDAKRFIQSYNASPNMVFQIVVGYTTEYASFVESKRGTTGYMQMVQWVEMNAAKAVE